MLLRAAILGPVRSLIRPSRRIAGLSYQPFVRFNSTKADDALKRVHQLKDDMQRDWDAPVLTYDEVKPRTQNPSPDTYLIDVREPDEAIQGSIPSSVNLPLSVLSNSLHLRADAFRAQHGFEKPRKDQEIIFYCRTGKRSATASDVAKRNGYTNIHNYVGSWVDWIDNESRKDLKTPPQADVSEISPERYHELSDVTMDTLLGSLESLLDNIGNPNFEVEYHSGVLTLNLGEKGTYVINKQPPNKQIWLSSPFSGPKRYDYVPCRDDWHYSRDGRTIGDLLNDELGQALDRKIELGIRKISKQSLRTLDATELTPPREK